MVDVESAGGVLSRMWNLLPAPPESGGVVDGGTAEYMEYNVRDTTQLNFRLSAN